MAETKISGATLTTAATTDLVPIGRPADTTARHVTVATLVQAQQASASARGSVELATDAEAITGTDTERAVTPASLAASATTHVTAATTSAAGKVELATTAETQAGTDTERAVTPAGVRAVTILTYNATAAGAAGGTDSTAVIQAQLDAAGVAGGGVVVLEPDASAYLLRVAGNSPNQSGHKYCLKFNYDNVGLEIRPGVTLSLDSGQQVDGAPVDMIVGRDVSNIRIFGGGRITGNTGGQSGWTGGYGQGTAGNIIDFDGSVGGGCTDITIENLTLDDHFGNPIWIDSGASSGQNNKRVWIKDIYFDKVGEGPNIVRCDGLCVTNVIGEDSTDCGVGDGIEPAACINVLINNITLSGFSGALIDLYGNNRVTVSNFVLRDSGADGISVAQAVGVDDVYDISIGNGIIYNPADYGITVDSSVHRLNLTNIVVYSAGESGFGIPAGSTIKQEGPVLCQGLAAYGCAAGMSLNGPVRDITITGCQFHDNTADGIVYLYYNETPDPSDIQNLVISNVSCCNNGRYGIFIDSGGVVGNTPTGTITNCTLLNNTSGGLYSGGAAMRYIRVSGTNPNREARLIYFYPAVGLDIVDNVGWGFATIATPSKEQTITMYFSGSGTVVDKTQDGGDNLNLAGGDNFSAVAGNWLCLQYDSTADEWYELWRRTS